MKSQITYDDLNLQAINGNWTVLQKADLPEWLKSQSVLEQKISLIGLTWMESLIAEVIHEEAPQPQKPSYPAPELTPILLHVLKSHKYYLLNEILILLHQSNLPLPALVVPDLLAISEKVFTQKANLRYLLPDWIADHNMPASSWSTFTRIPNLDTWSKINDEERLFVLRHLKLNGLTLDLELLNSFWSSSKTPARLQLLKIVDGTPHVHDFLHNKLNVRSRSLQLAVIKTLMKSKSMPYSAILDIVQSYWNKDDARLLSMSDLVKKDINKRLGLSEKIPFEIFQYLDPSDLSNDHSQWKRLRDTPLSDQEVRDFLFGALCFQDLPKVKFWMDHDRFYLDDDVLYALEDLNLSNYNLITEHVIRDGKIKQDSIIRWLLYRKDFMSKSLSKTTAEFIGRSINLEVDQNSLAELIHEFCYRSDPTIYQYLLNLRERNSLAPKLIIHALDKGLEDLRIRLQFRNVLSRAVPGSH